MIKKYLYSKTKFVKKFLSFRNKQLTHLFVQKFVSFAIVKNDKFKQQKTKFSEYKSLRKFKEFSERFIYKHKPQRVMTVNLSLVKTL